MFRTNLVLSNHQGQPVSATVRFRPRGTATVTATAALSFEPGETKFWGDAVRELLGLDDAVGSLELVEDPISPPIGAWARTYSDLGAAGTFGQFIPAFGSTDLLGMKGGALPGVAENAGFRTNLGLVNAGTVPVDVRVVLRREDGSKIGEKSWTLVPGESQFVFRAATVIGPGDTQVAAGRFEVFPSVPEAAYAWASIVDNLSTDQIFVRPAAIP